MRLHELPIGARATIEAMSGDPALLQRLYEFGLLEGETVELLALAPLGDPLEIRIGRTRLSLRRSEAACIAVRVSDR